MSNRLYVGNLPYSVSEESITNIFEDCGSVVSVKLITDQNTGKSKGFAFVEMGTDSEANKAREKHDGEYLDGRNIKVNQARPLQDSRSSRGGNRGSERFGSRNRNRY